MTAPTVNLADRIERCSSCRADIVWATTRDGKPIPLDPQPRFYGNLTIQLSDTVLHAGVVTPGQARAMNSAGIPTYVSHFVDCPDSDQWRTRR